MNVGVADISEQKIGLPEFEEAWQKAVRAAMASVSAGDPRKGVPCRGKLQEIKKKIRKELKEKGAYVLFSELKEGLVKGGYVAVYSSTGMSLKIKVPSIAPIKGLLGYEQKVALLVKKALLAGEPQKALEIAKKASIKAPEDFRGLWEDVLEAAKIRGYSVQQRCSFCANPVCTERTVLKTVVFTPNGVRTIKGWQPVAKLKSIFGPDIWAEWVTEEVPPEPCPHEHPAKTFPNVPEPLPLGDSTEPKAPDHFPGDIIGIPREDGSWDKVIHSPNHGLGSDESLEG